MKKIGIALDNIGPNQLAHGIIKSGNEFLAKAGEKVDLVLFLKQVIKPIRQPNFATMNMSEGFDYVGNYVATDLDTALGSLRYVGPTQRFFYVWDLEWVLPQNRHNFPLLKSIYQNPKLELIARSNTHKDIIELAWNRKVLGIVEDGNVEQFYEVIS